MAFPIIQAATTHWSRAEELKLTQLAKHNNLKIISLVLGRPEETIKRKAHELSIRIKT